MAIKICLDAGHYAKYNQSPVNKKYYESDVVWKLHLLLKKELEAYGFEVITTRRDKDKDLALLSRGKTAKGCDLFISLHSNACDTESVDYPVVIVPISGKGDAIGDKLAKCVTETMGTKQKGKIYKRKGGGNYDYYSVIYGAVNVGVVGIIIEHSFHTNKAATNWLLNDGNRKKLAKAEAEVIAEHYGLKKKEQPKEEFKSYLAKVTASVLNIRKGAGTNYAIVGSIKKNEVYTIVAEADGAGATKWGKLKSGAGWISLDYTTKA
jgi:N-acetylmuramoyl-L-alanine amidase